MKKNLFQLFFVATLFAAACNSSADETAKYTAEMVVNKTDFTCGMPTSAGISDTCHYEGKAYGFCSSECKAEFQKNPAAALAAAQ